MLTWDVDDGVELLRWERVDGVAGAFSGRRGGVSSGAFASLNLGVFTGDDVGRVVENRARLCAAVGADPAQTSSCFQVHSATVHAAAPLAAGEGFLDPDAERPYGDGLVATAPGRAVVAFAADCVPVLLARRDGSAVAACHAGWRGLVGGVVEETVRALGPGPLAAAVGPCAGRERYEVGLEVSEPLAARYGTDVAAGRSVDLARCAERALRGAGVDDVDVAGLCTMADPARFFSFRRDGKPLGQQCAVVYRRAA